MKIGSSIDRTAIRTVFPYPCRSVTIHFGYTESMLPPGCVKRLVLLLGPRACLDRPEDLALYEYDGGIDKHRPDVVVFPRDTKDVAGIVKIAQEFAVPFVGRGAGTGLSGGAIAREGGIMVAFARMNGILEIDLENERAVVQPGVVNLDISLAVDADGKFAPPIEAFLKEHADIVGPQLKNGITWILLGYASTMLWAAAVAKAGATDTDAVIAALEGMGPQQTLFGKVEFGPGKREGLPIDEYGLFRLTSFRNGGFSLA